MKAAVLLLLAFLTPTLASAHPYAPFDWWADTSLVCAAFPFWLEVVSDEPFDIEYAPGQFARYLFGVGQCRPSTTESLNYACNVANGDRWVTTFRLGPGSTTEERHGIAHYLGQRLPCR